jgi:hypothetical protein
MCSAHAGEERKSFLREMKTFAHATKLYMYTVAETPTRLITRRKSQLHFPRNFCFNDWLPCRSADLLKRLASRVFTAR